MDGGSIKDGPWIPQRNQVTESAAHYGPPIAQSGSANVEDSELRRLRRDQVDTVK
ncbi:hypothetical protein ACLOJK_020388 [Asimina triloba]